MNQGPPQSEVPVQRVAEVFDKAKQEIGKVIVGQKDLVEGTLVALFAEGSLLLEGAPGLGKTLLVNVLSRTVSCHFKRVQFTPDLMPSDLTGHSIYNLKEQEFDFRAGPIFTNLLLADEINRSPPKTQSALLEAMQERQVTVDGKTYRLPQPFLVLATQNPLEHEGTYPLPEAQVDRFMFKLLVDYPTPEEETDILNHYMEGKDPRDLASYGLEPVVSASEIVDIQKAAAGVLVEGPIRQYITELVSQTRNWHSVAVGASPRASVNLLVASRVLAATRGRDFVIPDDVKELAPDVLRHRLRLVGESEMEGETADRVITQILESVKAPRQ